MKPYHAAPFLLVLLGATGVSHAVDYEYREVTVAGTSQCESTRDSARKWAELSTRNKAHDACSSLGKGWSYDSVVIQGYVGYKACKSLGDGFVASFENSTHRCRRLDKQAMNQKAVEKSEADKAQRERDARANVLDRPIGLGEQIERERAKRAEKDKVARKKTARENATPTTEIDAAFQSLDRDRLKPTGGGFDTLGRQNSSGQYGLDALDATRKPAHASSGHGVEASIIEVEMSRLQREADAVRRHRERIVQEAKDRDAEAEKACMPVKWSPPFKGLVLISTCTSCPPPTLEEEMDAERERAERRREEAAAKAAHEASEREKQRQCETRRSAGPSVDTPVYRARLKQTDEKIAEKTRQLAAKAEELRALTRR